LAKPWTHHISAVVAAALAMYGRARAPAAAAARELRSTERLVKIVMPVFLPCSRPRVLKARVLVVVSRAQYRTMTNQAQTLIAAGRPELSIV
jgi:hypothetical protein